MRLPHAARSGFSLVDVCLSMALLVVGLGVLIGSTFSAMKLDQVNASTALANQALRGMCEEMQAMPIDEVLDSYVLRGDEDERARDAKLARLTLRDPALASRAGKKPVAAARFPLDGDGRTLREDLDLPALGLPRDLDGDGAIDSADKRATFRILPVVLELDWEGPSGPQHLQVSSVLRRP